MNILRICVKIKIKYLVKINPEITQKDEIIEEQFIYYYIMLFMY